MFSDQTYIERRAQLRRAVGGGVIIIPANCEAPNSYPNNPYYFRQDSSFRYLFALNAPSYVGVMDCDAGEDYLFGKEPTLIDTIWSGALPHLSEQAAHSGVPRSYPISELAAYVAKQQSLGREIHILPPYRGETVLQLCDLLGVNPSQLKSYTSTKLLFAMALMREVKSDEEIVEMEHAYAIGARMHRRAMELTRAGASERFVSGEMEGIARSYGGGVSFPSIYTQHGEILHNTSQGGVLQSGRMVLCDAGAETLSGYCSDHTRSYPVDGRFTQKQRDIYNIVLASHNHVRESARAGMFYADLHAEAQRVLVSGLRDVGLLRGEMEQIIESRVVELFMPHGVGHSLGMDVHDCEAFGERSFDFAPYDELAREYKVAVCRKYWLLREGAVITNEPGVYFIGALIDESRREGKYNSVVNWELLDTYRDFGGIRIEGDLLITRGGCREIGDDSIPKSVESIESFMKR
ncbi:MAG: aminopeptidase P family protein [Rikenellaceae bacterium]